jgi:DNA recombination protein RmuC
MLPASSFHMQHVFNDNDVVDAVINVKDKILPVDSKFSIDNYRRAVDAINDEDKKYFADEFKKDLKKRIEETSKYIKESEDTLPLAFMFIPSEAIYHDLLAGEQSQLKVNTQSLMEFAQSKKVFIVSPTSIIAYLHLVLSGIKAFKIEKEAEQIQKKVEELGKHIFEYQDYMKKLGASISTTVNHYNNATIKFKKIDKDVYKITDGKIDGEIELEKLEKPNSEE